MQYCSRCFFYHSKVLIVPANIEMTQNDASGIPVRQLSSLDITGQLGSPHTTLMTCVSVIFSKFEFFFPNVQAVVELSIVYCIKSTIHAGGRNCRFGDHYVGSSK